jgi:hypothetical protein
VKIAFLIAGGISAALALHFAFQAPMLSHNHPLAPNTLAGAASCGFAVCAGLCSVAAAIVHHGGSLAGARASSDKAE